MTRVSVKGAFSGSAAVNALIFFLFVFVGAVYIVSAKLADISPFAVTFGPVLIMLVYAGLIGAARLLRLRDDQSGDNLYYMGFLFTLTSLGVSLYQFDAAARAEAIVQNFGVAIASTIAGIALRVFFNQMRRDPIEVEATARAELAEAARRVRRELENSVLEFSSFRRALQQTVNDGYEETKVKVEEVGSRLLAGVEGGVRRSGEILDESFRDTLGRSAEITMKVLKDVERATQSLGTEVERLSRSAAQMAGGLDAVFTKLAAMRDPENVIEIKLAPALQGLTRVVNTFAKSSEAYATALGRAIEGADARANRTEAALDGLKGEVRSIQASISTIHETLVAERPNVDLTDPPLSDLAGRPATAAGRWWSRR